MSNMMHSLRRVAASISPVRARAKVLARENREMRAALVRVRREGGLTQADVAEMLGVSQQAVNKLERYDADPRLSTLERYANAVGALVHHRVEVDRGQSLRLTQPTAWVASRATAPRFVRAVPSERTRTIDGWQLASTLVPAEMVAR